MKKLILTYAFFVFSITLNAQEKMSCAINGEIIEFTVSGNEIYVGFNEGQKETIKKQAQQDFITGLTENSALLSVKNLIGPYETKKNNLQSKFTIKLERMEPILIYQDGTKQIATGELNIKLKPNDSLDKIFKGIKYSSQKNQFEKNLYLVKTDLKTSELFHLVNQLQTNSQVEFIEPNFIRMIKTHTNDPYFNSQWSIKNQGYLGGTVDADMDVDDSWNFSTGSGVTVAVIDEGVDLTHTDLTANLLSGYDATGNGSNGGPNENTNDAHGTACAGIIAAIAGNSSGIAGIAYNAKILPVRIAYSNGFPIGDNRRAWVTNDNWIANGINWAWQNGADILSNSWGGGSPSSTITNSINNAVNNGRSSKGCVVLFSTGNYNTNISYPATLDNVIAVGATSMCDERKSSTSNAALLQGTLVQSDPNGTSCDGEWWWGSNYGSQTDVVASGVQIYTTDISGSAGYDASDYDSNFNGTSSACPNTAGVAALILSAKPSLTQQELRNILELNTDKVGGYAYSTTSGHPNGTWNNEMGYGRVNALKAVEEVILGNLELTGNNSICNSNTFYSLSPVPNGILVNWSVSSNLQIVSSSTVGATVKAINSTVQGNGFVTATVGTRVITKNVWVGIPSVPSSILGFCCNGMEFGSESIYEFTVDLANNQSVNQFNWVVAGGTILEGQGTNTIFVKTAKVTGSIDIYFDVSVRVGNNCGWSSYLWRSGYVISGVGPAMFSVYPNPANYEVTISVADIQVLSETNTTNGVISVGEVKIYDFFGTIKKVKKTNSNQKSITINVTDLQKGTYLILINSGTITESHKLIIE